MVGGDDIVSIEKIYNKYCILLYHKHSYYTAYDITIDTNFGKIYLKQFTPLAKIYSHRSEFDDPSYHSEKIGVQIGYNMWPIINYNANKYLEHDFIIFGNEIKNIDAITFYKDGDIKIEFVKQTIIIKNETYEEAEFIFYSPSEKYLEIGSGLYGSNYIIIINDF
jgi:hypothetical protein